MRTSALLMHGKRVENLRNTFFRSNALHWQIARAALAHSCGPGCSFLPSALRFLDRKCRGGGAAPRMLTMEKLLRGETA